MISICNENSLITPAALEFSKEIGSKLNTSSSGLNRYYSTDPDDPMFMRFLVTMMIADPIYNDSIRQAFTVPFNQTIKRCLINQEPCTADDFEW